MINRGLNAELDAHLGYDEADRSSTGKRSNSRHGRTSKTVKGTFGELQIDTPAPRSRPMVALLLIQAMNSLEQSAQPGISSCDRSPT